LAAACGASGHRSLTSRNWLAPIRTAVARRAPDLLGSWEGGSNLTLVRGTAIRERRDMRLRLLPERRTMAYTRLESGLCIANLHASSVPRLAEEEVVTAATHAVSWADGSPLIFGGDLNLRPDHSGVFTSLEERLELRGVTAPGVIDHLLSRGLDVVEHGSAWRPEVREIRSDGRSLRLSDHAPIAAVFARPSVNRR
jgi:endonuclease/exonuclease/phosphatase family metal-dependent hydrolase